MISETLFYEGAYPPIELGGLPQDIMMAKPDITIDSPVLMEVKSKSEVENVKEPKIETTLGNDMTKSQKWAWVIGLTFAAWALIYWNEKNMK